ncbi:PAS domain S-box protein [Methanogenium sp. S4BF]|uniref:PAS domain S-box protein n=1 Tax=Methanogenium sp. S4BF TaxID=1789226 RepID=UPI002416513B|nr:PAS domain S-box protein [Methanogenium sp. S4BF]WFN34124.1 PAS domain S-box protein [Methanogenium sp. S4BF]
MMAAGQNGRLIYRTEQCTGCDYLGARSFARISPARELIPDDVFLRIFPFCRGRTPLPFLFWLEGLTCNPEDRQRIEEACDLVCTAREGHTFSTPPIIFRSEREETAASGLYGLSFHATPPQSPSLCIIRFPAAQRNAPADLTAPDWSCLDSMNEAVIILSPDARVHWSNRVGRRELSSAGMEEGAPVSAFWKRVMWEDGTCPLSEFIPASMEKASVDIFVEDTLERSWRIRTGLLGDSADSFTGYIQTAVEMTEWMARRVKLSDIEHMFAAFMENLPSAAAILDLNGRVRYCNPQMDQFFCRNGYADGQGGYTFPPEMIRTVTALFPEVLKKGSVSTERRHTEPEKHDLIYQLTFFSISRSGCPPLIGAIAVDQTEERKNEKQRAALAATLFEAQKAARMGSWQYDDETGSITFRGLSPGDLFLSDTPLSMPLEVFLRSLPPQDAARVRQAVSDRSVDVLHELTVSLKNTDGEVMYAAFRARNRTDGIKGTVGTIQDITDRVKAEKARAQSEERFRLYFNSKMAGSMIIEPLYNDEGDFSSFRFLAANQSFGRMMGVDQGTVIGKNVDDLFPDDAREWVSLFHDAVMEGGSYTAEWTCSQRGKTFSGHIFPLGGSRTSYGCSFIDVSHECEALRVLQENDEFLKIIFPATIEGILVIDAEMHTILDANATACDLIGAGRDEIIGCLCRDVICPAKDGFCPVTDLGEEVHMSERILLTADGDRIPVLKSVRQVVYQGRKCLIEMIVDLRKIKAAEDALNIAEERYRMVFETSPDGILITDTELISEVNPAFATALGYLPEEMKGRSVLDFAPEFQEDGVRSSHRRIEILREIMGGRRISIQWDAISRDGLLVRFEIRGGLVNYLGKVMVVLVGRNVTELLNLKRRQREALDQIENNLANLATLNDHIRNPLMVISAYTEMDATEHAKVVMDQIQEIDGIINMLDRGFLESEKIREFLRKHHDVETISND